MAFLPDVKSKIFVATGSSSDTGYSDGTVAFADRSIRGRLRLHGFVTAGMFNDNGNWGNGGYKTVALGVVQLFDLDSVLDQEDTKRVEFPLTAAGNYNSGGPNYCDFGGNYIQFDNGIYLKDERLQNSVALSDAKSVLKYMSLEIFYSLG
jgi:hypothetical protein